MWIHASRNGFKAFFILAISALIIGQTNAPTAQAEDYNLPELIQKVKPSIAKIVVTDEKGKTLGSGSGFLVNDKGMVATNYHVIEGAKYIKVIFPGYKGGKEFKSPGYIGFLQTHDIAIVQVKPEELFGKEDGKKGKKAKDDKKKDGEKEEEVIKPLPMAEKRPMQGETVIAYGAPLGISDTVTTGVVSAVRSGKDLAKLLQDMFRVDVYGKQMGYSKEAYWIHMTAPISPGNSGGPLINTKGEVIGLNTWHLPAGQNMNFAISIEHVKKFVDNAGANVQSYANLPEPREKHEVGHIGNPKKTLAYWKGYNRAKNALDEEVEKSGKRLDRLPAIDPRNPMKGKNRRDKMIANHFRRVGDAYSDYSSAISGMDNKSVDFQLIGLVVNDTIVAKKISESCNEMGSKATGGGLSELNWGAVLSMWKQLYSEIDTERELLRVNLGLRYNLDFPTQAETAEEDRKNGVNGKSTASSSKANAKRAVMRTWTDKSGKFKIRAKCVGVKDGEVQLELSSGKVITVPLEKLSEADKRFIASTG